MSMQAHVESTLPGIGLLPRHLDVLLREMQAVQTYQLAIRGFASSCADGEHQLAAWQVGVFRHRILRLSMCIDCETVEVRDVTRHSLPIPGGAVNSPDELLGWYSGARAAGRAYM